MDILQIKKNLKEITTGKKTVVLFTGSKESTVLLAGADDIDSKVIFIDTGYHFNEILDYIKKLTDKVETVHNKAVSADPASDMKECCRLRKASVLKEYLQSIKAECLIVPFRDEDRGNGVEDSYLAEIDDMNIARPLASLSERDIWINIKENKLLFSKIYSKGYRFIDCKLCTTRGGRKRQEGGAGRKMDKETDEETVRKLKALGYM